MGRSLVYGEGVVVGTSRCRCCAGIAPHRLCVSCMGCCEPRIVLHVNNNKTHRNNMPRHCHVFAMLMPLLSNGNNLAIAWQ